MNRDAKRTADSPIGQRHVITLTVRELERQRQAAEKVRQLILFISFVSFVLFI